ncbi:Peptidase family M23 [Pseudarcicella hirudinis]|uniref:Peptidase family M23 n=1 Tax=Pseudarcicella hirudinis TaxID=1079859 RepID=A0A1I5SV45_9BACT|nr:peptidoglycan DD-metalloendopeptidase family protein [Pseudarcicella hirudinis]SFP74645.1 Peptidase family M23 [Pseudarcicella hirudinis]
MELNTLLKKYQHEFAAVVPFNWQSDKVLKLDLTAGNPDLHTIDLNDTKVFEAYLFGKIKQANAVCGFGGYMENRYIYQKRDHFQHSDESRSIHLGVDIWAKAGTPVFTPLAGKIHSFQNNDNFGDYGPTIIVEHELENTIFFTLYGHLDLASLNGLFEGKFIEKGQRIASFGDYPVNGNWPPHLHFQVISEMQGKKGDFWGVCKPSEKDKFSIICPDANIVLKLDEKFYE